jgi:GMP synthase-like glutamine amidotransferase
LRATQADIPLFGVGRYGHQSMTWALGGKVDWMTEPPREIGSHEVTLAEAATDDPLLQGCPSDSMRSSRTSRR